MMNAHCSSILTLLFVFVVRRIVLSLGRKIRKSSSKLTTQHKSAAALSPCCQLYTCTQKFHSTGPGTLRSSSLFSITLFTHVAQIIDMTEIYAYHSDSTVHSWDCQMPRDWRGSVLAMMSSAFGQLGQMSTNEMWKCEAVKFTSVPRWIYMNTVWQF